MGPNGNLAQPIGRAVTESVWCCDQLGLACSGCLTEAKA